MTIRGGKQMPFLKISMRCDIDSIWIVFIKK